MGRDSRRGDEQEDLTLRLRAELDDARQIILNCQRELERRVSELKAVRELSEAVVDFAGVAIAVSDVEGRWLTCNTCFSNLLGYGLEDLKELTNLQITHPEDRAESRALMRDLLEGRIDSFRTEKRYLHRDGQDVWIDLSVTPIRDDEGEIVALIGAGMDVTQRKETESKLAWELEVHAAVARLGNTLLDPSLSIGKIADLVLDEARAISRSEHGFVSAVDPETGDNVGYTVTRMMESDELAQMSELALSPGPDGRYPGLLGHALNTGQPFFTNEPGRHEAFRGVPQDHGAVESFLTVPVVFDGDPLGQIAVANAPGGYTERELEAVKRFAHLYGLALQRERETKTRQELEKQLRHSQKMEAIGRLASGTAHDFNNLLMAASAQSEMALRKLSEDHPARRNVRQIRATTERGRELTKQLLIFARKQELELRPLDLNELIQGFGYMLRRTLREDIVVRIRPRDEAIWIKGDATQIEQILMNISVNAQDAMPNGGALTIEVEAARLGPEDPTSTPELRPGSYALLRVRDTGQGMSPETAARAFEPFFTTKAPGEGTGLGLSTAYGIVRQHDGQVRLETEPGRGTTFSIMFPRLEAPTRPSTASDRTSALPQGNETILVVEDDQIVRKSLCRMLGMLGYQVLEAPTPSAALATASERLDSINMLMTDIVMPEMNGVRLADEVVRIIPGIRVLFVSGYPDEVLARYHLVEPSTNYLRKPFSISELSYKIREVLEKA